MKSHLHLNVLFLTRRYPNHRNLMEAVFTREHALAVQTIGQVLVLHLAGKDKGIGRLWKLELEQDASIHKGIPTYRLWINGKVPKSIRLLIELIVLFWLSVRGLIREFKPVIIHGHSYSCGPTACLLARLLKRPLIISEHTSFFKRGLVPLSHRYLAKLIYRCAHLVAPLSRSLRDSLIDSGISANFKIIPITIDTTIFKPAPASNRENDEVRILFVGNIDKYDHKGLGLIMTALSCLRDQRGKWRLDVVGDGEGRKQLEEMARSLDLAHYSHFHGKVSRDEVLRHMKMTDFFVLPSKYETFGSVIVEALACGAPVITTNAGGPAEYITDEVGTLVSPGDLAELTSAIDYMFLNHANYEPDALHYYVESRYSYRVVGKKIDDLYRSLLDQEILNGK